MPRAAISAVGEVAVPPIPECQEIQSEDVTNWHIRSINSYELAQEQRPRSGAAAAATAGGTGATQQKEVINNG